jgi:hypothetical protein
LRKWRNIWDTKLIKTNKEGGDLWSKQMQLILT